MHGEAFASGNKFSAMRPPQSGIEYVLKHLRTPTVWFLRYCELYDGEAPSDHAWETCRLDADQTPEVDLVVENVLLPQEFRGARTVVAWACYDSDGKELFGSRGDLDA